LLSEDREALQYNGKHRLPSGQNTAIVTMLESAAARNQEAFHNRLIVDILDSFKMQNIGWQPFDLLWDLRLS
jgi:hypothetical protein